MIAKVVVLFLVFMGVLAMFGKLRAPRLPGAGKARDRLSPTRCPDCARFRIGKGPCPCGKDS